LAAQEGRTLRADPIVYPHDDYTNPVRVQFGNNPAPISWLQNDGCYCEDSRMFIAEYTRFQHDYAYVWRVGKPYTNKSDWEIVKSFKVSGEIRGFKHCHNIERDPFTGVLWLTTGDIPPNSGEQLEGTPGIYYSSDNGTTWATLLEGSEKYCRQINFIWLEDYVYWCSDTSDVSKHFLIRAKRNTNGIIDISTIEDLYQWYLPVATYNICYCENPKGILCLDRYDRTTDATEPIPFLFWDIEKGQMVCIGGSDIYNGTMAGYRVEGMSHYPQANGEGYLIGFGLHPNWMKFPGNILNTHDNGGYTVKAEYNIGCLNNLVVKIIP
jgi:hypothetical protein